MLFTTTLYLALAIFGIGLIYRAATWFVKAVGTGPQNIGIGTRVFSAVRGVFGTIFSPRIGSVLVTFVLDTLLQIRILKDRTGPLVWVFHILIFIGFMGLLIMHAMDDLLAPILFANYYPTLDPYRFLRNLFGVMVLAGLVLAILRRFVFERRRIKSGVDDVFAVVLLVLIMLSGFWLEATKITSYDAYQRMADEYSSAMDETEVRALEAYWVKYYGMVSPNDLSDVTPEMLETAAEINQDDCVYCHTRPSSAFFSWILANATKQDALAKDEIDLAGKLNAIHYLLCFIGLAYLPFGKMFHVISTPLSLLVAAGSRRKEEDSANIPTRQMIELAGCSHGGSCHLSCPVRVRREERIEGAPQFSPALDFLEKTDYKALGSRKFVK
jgi:nitrate reductase gamma subunit